METNSPIHTEQSQYNPDANITDPDIFHLLLLSDEFKPRAKQGERLVMYRGAVAEDGDIVALPSKNYPDCPELAFYTKDVDYYAVCGAIMAPYRPTQAAKGMVQ